MKHVTISLPVPMMCTHFDPTRHVFDFMVHKITQIMSAIMTSSHEFRSGTCLNWAHLSQVDTVNLKEDTQRTVCRKFAFLEWLSTYCLPPCRIEMDMTLYFIQQAIKRGGRGILLTHPLTVSREVSEHNVKILVFLSPTSYMLTSLVFSLLIWGILYTFL